MDTEPISIRALVHHLEHLVLYSLIWWQVVLSVWLVLKWTNKNWKIKKTFSVMSPTENKTQTLQPVINIDGASIGEGIAKKKKDMGPVDVNVDRNVFIDKANLKGDAYVINMPGDWDHLEDYIKEIAQ